MAQAMETMAMAPKQPVIVTAKQIKQYQDQWDQSLSKPMPYLPIDWNPDEPFMPQRLGGSFSDAGAQQIMTMSIDDIKATSTVHDASRGATGPEISGKAIIARQQQGDNSTYVFHDGLVNGVQYGYQILIDLIPKVIDTERNVRVRDKKGKESWVTVNKKKFDPTRREETTENDLSAGRYRVVAKASRAYASRRLEAVDGMAQLVQAAPMFAPVIGPRIAENSDWPDADKVGEEMRAITGAAGQPDPGAQLDQQKKELDVANKAADLERKTTALTKEQQDQAQQMASIAQQVVLSTLGELGLLPGRPGQPTA